MPRKTPPCEVYPEWTQARFWGFVRSGLRSASSRWPPKYQALANAKRKYEGPNKRQKWEYQCASCGGWFPTKEVSVDHIEPVGTLKDYEDLPEFVQRLFCGIEGLQILCSSCHSKKTKEERTKHASK